MRKKNEYKTILNFVLNAFFPKVLLSFGFDF